MIRVTIEMVPGGLETLKYHMHTIEIWNDVTGTLSNGNYKARLSRKGNDPNTVWKTTEVKDFPRKQRNSYDLLYRVLREVVGDRNPQKEKK